MLKRLDLSATSRTSQRRRSTHVSHLHSSLVIRRFRLLNHPLAVFVFAGLAAFLVFLFNFSLFYYFYIKPSPGKPWLVGTARVDITPEETVWLSGFASRNRTSNSTTPLSPLFARAISFRHSSDPAQSFVIVSLDIIGIDRKLSDRIYEVANDQLSLPRERLRICVTHTHSGPVIGNNLAPLVPLDPFELAKISRYSKHLVELVIYVIRRSLAQQLPASAHFAQGMARVAVNRRQIRESTFDGHRGMTEDSVPVLWFTSGQEIIGGIWGYSAHATVLTSAYRYSGDYPGVTSQLLERDGSVWLYAAGCGGDQNIYPRGTNAHVRLYATLLSSVVAKLTASGGETLNTGISAKHSFLRLPFAKRYTARELYRRGHSKDSVTRRGAEVLLHNLDIDGLTPLDYEYGIGVWNIGRIKIVFLGGEPTVGYCSSLRDIGASWVVGYCEDVMGYIGTKDVIESGGREGGDRAAWYYGLPAAWKVSVNQIIVDGVRKLL